MILSIPLFGFRRKPLIDQAVGEFLVLSIPLFGFDLYDFTSQYFGGDLSIPLFGFLTILITVLFIEDTIAFNSIVWILLP